MKNNKKIIELYFESIRGFNEFEKNPHDFGTGDLLFGSEIHTIQKIGYNQNINLTDLADKLNISKSAVSKFTKRLLNKDLITKTRKLNNDKEVVFNLTNKGLTAFTTHEKFEEEMFKSIKNLINDFSEEQSLFMESFLSDLVQNINTINNNEK